MNLNNAFIDLFAGAGGFSIGLIQAKWKCLAAFEYATDAINTYYRNMGLSGWTKLMVDPEDTKKKEKLKRLGPPNLNLPTFDWDIPEDNWTEADGKFPVLSIWTQDLNKLDPKGVMEYLGIPEGELGLMVGGPPCQGFSYANMNRNEGDERNQLVFRYMDYVEAFKPKIFMIENVLGLLTIGKNEGEKIGPFPKWITKRANDIGYNLTYDIHDMSKYGLPQKRRRVLFYGTRKDANLDPVFKMEETHNYNYFEDNNQLELFDDWKKEPYVTIFETIGDLDWPLSSSRDEDAIKFPFGSRERGPSELTSDNMVRHEDHFMVKDRFNGKWFRIDKSPFYENREHYKRCPECNKFNIIVRQKCHYCKNEFNE